METLFLQQFIYYHLSQKNEICNWITKNWSSNLHQFYRWKRWSILIWFWNKPELVNSHLRIRVRVIPSWVQSTHSRAEICCDVIPAYQTRHTFNATCGVSLFGFPCVLKWWHHKKCFFLKLWVLFDCSKQPIWKKFTCKKMAAEIWVFEVQSASY